MQVVGCGLVHVCTASGLHAQPMGTCTARAGMIDGSTHSWPCMHSTAVILCSLQGGRGVRHVRCRPSQQAGPGCRLQLWARGCGEDAGWQGGRQLQGMACMRVRGLASWGMMAWQT